MIKFDANGQGYFDFSTSQAIESLTLDQALTIINFLYDLESEINEAVNGRSFFDQDFYDFYAIRRGIDERDSLRDALRQHIKALRGLV